MFIHDTPAAFFGRGIKITFDIIEKWYKDYNKSIDEFQNYLLKQTFENSAFDSLSIRIKYRENFIKSIINWIEKQNDTEVNSRWYELIADLANRSSYEEDWCHTIYFLNNNKYVIHRQTTALLSHGLTGLSNWPASIYLGDYLMKNIDQLNKKHIIELGSGSGLLGLALLKYTENILSYTFTDYSEMILNLLRQNILLNFTEEDFQQKIRLLELDWNENTIETSNQYDMIVATDVVYDPSVIEGLVKTIKYLLQINKQSSAYVANAIRNESTYDQFRKELDRSLLKIQSIDKDIDQTIEILEIKIVY